MKIYLHLHIISQETNNSMNVSSRFIFVQKDITQYNNKNY